MTNFTKNMMIAVVALMVAPGVAGFISSHRCSAIEGLPALSRTNKHQRLAFECNDSGEIVTR